MVKHALFILESEERLNQFKKAARKKAKEFDINQILPLYENLYRKND